jgi:peptide/nickel transport system substrate-binding protein
LSACARTGDPPPTHHRVVIAYSREPRTLDPVLETGAVQTLIMDLVFDPLLQYDDHGRWIPALALAEPTIANGGITQGGKRITFHLRRGVRWHDGAPFTARDVKFTYEAYLNPRNDVGSREQFVSIAAIATPDPYTVVFTLHHPTASFLSDILSAIVPEHILGRGPNINHAPFNGNPVGTGAYRFVSWKRSDHLVLRANADYWRGRPAIADLAVAFIPNQQTLLTQMRTREADVWWMADTSLLAQIRALPRTRVSVRPIRSWGELGMNLHDPILADIRVRRAIAHALDIRSFNARATHAAFSISAIPEAIFGWAYDPRVQLPRYDPAASARLLDAAGWHRNADGIRRRGGVPLQLLLVTRNDREYLRIVASLVQDALRAQGIIVQQKLYPATLLVETAADGGILARGQFQLELDAYITNPDPDPSWLLACSEIPPAGYNYWHYCSPRSDALLAAARATYARPERSRDYAALQERLAEDIPSIDLFRVIEYDVSPDWLQGISPSDFSLFWNAWSWKASRGASAVADDEIAPVALTSLSSTRSSRDR